MVTSTGAGDTLIQNFSYVLKFFKSLDSPETFSQKLAGEVPNKKSPSEPRASGEKSIWEDFEEKLEEKVSKNRFGLAKSIFRPQKRRKIF